MEVVPWDNGGSDSMRTRERPSWSYLGGLALSAALVLGMSGVAAADTELGHRGLVGRHALRDRAIDGQGGARCDYSFSDARDGGAATITVLGPRVFARNRTAGVDHQRVGWQVILQQTPDDIGYGTWYTVATSGIVKADATDQTRAAFSARTLDVPFNTFVRAKVKVIWYAPGSSTVIEGTAVHRVDHYDRYLDSVFEDQVAGSCPNDLTDPI